MKDTIWFDYLKGRIAYIDEPEEGCRLLIRLFTDRPRIECRTRRRDALFLADTGNHTQFYELAQKMFDLVAVEEDFREFLEICYLHYTHLDLPEPGHILSEIFHKRKPIGSDPAVDPNDPDLRTLRAVLDQKLHL